MTLATTAADAVASGGGPGVWLGYLTVAATLVLGWHVIFRGPNPENSQRKNVGIGFGFWAMAIVVIVGAAVLAPGWADSARADMVTDKVTDVVSGGDQ